MLNPVLIQRHSYWGLHSSASVPAGFSASQLHNYYSGTLLTPDLSPLLSESSVFLLHSLYPHFTGVLALVSSLEMMCGR